MKILKESEKLIFHSYHEFLMYIKKNNLKWKDYGPFTVYERNGKQATLFKTVGDVLESFEE